MDSVLGPFSERELDEQVTYDRISALNGSYLNFALKEVMRLCPSICGLGRILTAPCDVGEYLLPSGTNVGIIILALHRNPLYWDRPEEFLPERWAEGGSANPLKHPFQYLPFSAGARNCIGQRFAMMEMTVALALVLRNFDLELTEEDNAAIVAEQTITNKPINVHIHISKRE